MLLRPVPSYKEAAGEGEKGKAGRSERKEKGKRETVRERVTIRLIMSGKRWKALADARSQRTMQGAKSSNGVGGC